ncbi:metallophosphoesterase [Deinococcus sp. A31D244]|uniref:metallophosphoesterase n=1 Tax=Deinococcus sp. A31D244 TaxID=3397675 RepID=UPI0039DF7B5C
MTEPRLPIALADIHGRLDLLDAALAAFPDRTFVLLGDYIDRGPDSAGVIGRVRELVESGRAVACLGNHDEWMIDVCLRGGDQTGWLQNGGQATIDSYRDDWAAMTADAQWMQDALLPWHTHGHVLFSHAMRPDPTGHDLHAHTWGRPDGSTPFYALPDGVTHSVHGHTPMQQPTQFTSADGSTAWFLDLGACWTGVLCVFDAETMTPRVIRAQVPA